MTKDELYASLTDQERERLAIELGSTRWTRLPLATLAEAIARLRRPKGATQFTRAEFWAD